MLYKVSELSGGLLDAAVAECGEWKTAHEHFPTMTLDPQFQGYYIVEWAGEKHCLLRPRNPMRQDPQHFRPSTDWAISGPIIERERIGFQHHSFNQSGEIVRSVDAFISGNRPSIGPTILISAMRAYVKSKFGETIDLP